MQKHDTVLHNCPDQSYFFRIGERCCVRVVFPVWQTRSGLIEETGFLRINSRRRMSWTQKKKKLVSDSFAWPIWGERRINNSFCSFFVVVQKCRESFGNYVALMWAITEILCNALRVSCAVKNSKSSITLNSKLLRRFFGFLNEIDSARAVVWQRRILPEGEELFLMFYTIQDGNGRINLYIPWIPRKNCFMFPRKQGNYIVHVSECCGFFMWPNCDTIGSRRKKLEVLSWRFFFVCTPLGLSSQAICDGSVMHIQVSPILSWLKSHSSPASFFLPISKYLPL